MENNLFTFKTISDFLNHIVIPEIDNRISNGLLSNTNLPIIINQFQILWDKQNNRIIVELNEEVRIQVKFRPRRPSIKTSEALTVDDIYTDDCYIINPKIDNKICPFYICKSLFLGFNTYFNFLPNDPNYNEEEFKNLNIRYNILDFDNSIKFKKVVEPYEKYKMLSSENWPPAPNFYPKIILEYHNNPEIINNGQIVDKILQVYCYDFWKKYLDFWHVCNFFPGRLIYLEKSINCFFNKDYISSIYVLVPQFEGIIKDYLISNNIITVNNWRLGFETCVKKLEELIYSRKILMFPKETFELIFKYLKTGTFWSDTSNITNPNVEVNRHGILHGLFTGFECQEISLKYLLLLDILSFILLQDKIITHKI